MLFSGELSMTSVLPVVLVPVLEVEVEVPVAPVDGELLDEQAARPAARSPVAAIATALLLIGLIVNFDCPLVLSVRADFYFLGDDFYFW
jgi:hypothetical protein